MTETGNILIVEDNDFVRMQVVSFLKGAGYAVLEATDGGEALAIVAEHGKGAGIALAIVDVRMEPMGGFEFVKALRGDDIALPVIMATGDQTPDILERSGKWGVSAVLMKPVEKDRLIKMVERVIKQSARG